MRTAVVGGGAAGFFLAINLKELMPKMEVTIFERSSRVLAKVAVSGGGRCNCTNTFHLVSDLAQVYPRGHRQLQFPGGLDYGLRRSHEHQEPLGNVTHGQRTCRQPSRARAHVLA